MNFLDKIVIPPGVEHAALLNVLQILTLLIFLPFTGMILGGTAISVFYNRKGKNETSEDKQKLPITVLPTLRFFIAISPGPPRDSQKDRSLIAIIRTCKRR